MLYNCSLDSLRGYSYTVPNSIINCPYNLQGGIIMPLANSLQFFNGVKSTTIFQTKRFINAIDMKNDFITIGEKASPGQLISAVVLDMKDLSNGKIFNYQKTQINHITVSADGEFFCSVGSSSDLIEEMTVIQVNNQAEVGTRIFYSRVFKKRQGKVMAIKFSNRDPHFFVLLCINKVILYRIDQQNEEVSERIARTSKIRQYTNIIFNPDDTLLYGCSLNGDIAELSIQECKQIRIGPRKRVITKGITNIKYLQPGMLIITGNEGLMALIQLQQMKLLKEVKLPDDKIISLTQFYNNQAYISSNKAMIYKINATNFHMEVVYTAHSKNINALCFLKDFSQIFGTCSGSDVIIWKAKTLAPILRISIAKVTCLSINFPKNGKYILSGWSDDSIRIFSPKNGKLIHHVRESNLGKVKEMISDEDSTIMICGGQNGMIRMWNLVQSKILGLIYGSLAYHLKPIHCLCMNPYNPNQLVSCCEDGKFAVWSLNNFELRSSFFITNFIKDLYFIDETTIRLAGSGNVIYQCLVADGCIRKQFQVDSTYINGIQECLIDSTGETLMFYSGSQNFLTYFDMLIKKIELAKLPSYGQINRMKLSPDKTSIIAVTANGIVLKYNIFGITKVNLQDY